MGKLLSTMWSNLDKYKVDFTFAKRHTKIHLQHRMSRPTNERSNTIILWLGETGIGKSSSLKSMAADLGVKYCRWDARAQLFEDNLGIPDPAGKEVKLDDGTIKKVTANMEAELLPIFEKDPVLLEVGELPTATQDVLNQIREIIDGIFTNRPVSPTCMMVATGNPLTDDYTTVNADLCASIEERLHPYLIVPTREERLTIWSTMMCSTVYQFLLKHQSFIEALSPRGWVEVAEKVQALVDADIDAGDICKDVRSKLQDDTVLVPLTQYIKQGYRPDQVPILGRDLFGSMDDMALEHLERIERWFKKEERGFVGATKMDAIRVMLQGGPDFVTKYPAAGERFTMLAETCIAHGAHDIAMSMLSALYNCDKATVQRPIMEKFRESSAIVELTDKFVEFNDKLEAMKAT